MTKLYAIVCAAGLWAAFGCTQVYTSAYGVAVDERSVGTIASDQKTKLTIQEKLLRDKAVHLVDVSVFCYAGDVYLVGEYEYPGDRERATAIARTADDVRSVTPYLLRKNKSGSCGTTDNLAIAAKINARLVGDRDIMSTNIDVKVVQCRAVLLGIVGSRKQAARAASHARSVSGVRDVTSFLKTRN